MHSLRELIEVSAYVPAAGYSLDMAKMAKAGLERSEALARWVAMGRSEGSFYKAYKALKDDLVKLAFKKSAGLEGKRIGVWEKYAVVNQLLVAGKKKAAVSLAIELVDAAKRAGFTEMVVSLTIMLEEHFGSLEVDTRRYLRYRKIRKEYSELMTDELEVRALLGELVFNLNKNKGLEGLGGKLEKLSNKKKGSFIFMRYRFTALSVWLEYKGEIDGLISLARETVKFYGGCGVEVSASSTVNIYHVIIPVLAKSGRFAEAESEISRALKVTLAGSQNWHLLMLQKACIGIQSNKLPMAHSALRMALDAPREHENPDIDRRWQVVEAILKGKAVSDVWKEVLG